MMQTPAETAENERMSCMEVWGGSEAAEQGFTMPGLDVWVCSQPYPDAASGGREVHFLSSCASGRITRMMIADICSLGPVFSQLASQLRDLMIRNVNAIRQARLVREINEQLHVFSDRGGYATTLISTYFAPTRSFTVCNAGHPPPLLFRAEDQTWSLIKGSPTTVESAESAPLGVLTEDEYLHFNSRLDDGDMVLSYSNCLSECRDSSGQTIGATGILDRVSRLHFDDPAHLVRSLVSQLRDENHENFSQCDLTLMLCRANSTSVRLRDNFLAPLRLLGRVSDKTTIDR